MSDNGGLEPLTDGQLRKALLKRRNEHVLLIQDMDAGSLRALEHRIYKLIRLADSRGLPFLTDADREVLRINRAIRRTVSVDLVYREADITISNGFSLQINGGSEPFCSVLPEQSEKFLKKLRRLHPEILSYDTHGMGITHSGTLKLVLDDGSELVFDMSRYPECKSEAIQDLVNRTNSICITVDMG